MMGKRKAAKAVVSIALAGCLVGSLGLNIYQADQASAQNAKVNKFIDNQLERQAAEEEKENTYQEDGFVIGGEYEIRSTASISDAYLSGDESGLSEEDKETLKLASDILKEIITDGMSDYEKELAVYRWMYKNIGQGSSSVVTLPGTAGSVYTPHGVLSGHNAVCVGYATTFRLFMNMLKMDCHIVHNDYHSWDLVKLDDGNWYQVDIYSDVSGRVKYQNFNMTDEVSRRSHEWDDSALPAATGVKYSYVVQNCKEIDSIYDVPKKLKKAIDKKKSGLYFKFKKKLEREELGIADLLVDQANMSLMSVMGYDSYNISGSWYTDEDENYILALYIVNYAESDSSSSVDPDSKEGKEMIQAVTDAFASLEPIQPENGGDSGVAAQEDVMNDETSTFEMEFTEDVDVATPVG